MDFTRSPEDNTCVIRILGELDSFVRGPNVKHKALQLSNASATAFKLHTPKDHVMHSDERVELLAAKAKIATLEAEVNTEKKEKQRIEIENGKAHALLKRQSSQQYNELLDMNRSFHKIVSREEDAREELLDLSSQLVSLKAKSVEEQKLWHLEKQKLTLKLEQVEEDHVKQMSELKEKFTRFIYTASVPIFIDERKRRASLEKK